MRPYKTAAEWLADNEKDPLADYVRRKGILCKGVNAPVWMVRGNCVLSYAGYWRLSIILLHNHTFMVVAADADDQICTKDGLTLTDALYQVADILKLAPLDMRELDVLGFRF